MPNEQVERNAAIVAAYLGGASMTDIAQSIGISRARVGQIIDRTGHRRSGRPGKSGWRPLNTRDFFLKSTSARVIKYKRYRDSLHRWRKWRREAVGTLKRLRHELNRVPTYGEIGEALGIDYRQAAPLVGVRWIGNNRGSRANGMHRFYRLAGLKPREPGSPGHL